MHPETSVSGKGIWMIVAHVQFQCPVRAHVAEPRIQEIRAVNRSVEEPGEQRMLQFQAQKKWAKDWRSERSEKPPFYVSRTFGDTTWPPGLIKIVGLRRRQPKRWQIVGSHTHINFRNKSRFDPSVSRKCERQEDTSAGEGVAIDGTSAFGGGGSRTCFDLGFLSRLGLPAINLAIPLKNIRNIFNKKRLGYIEGLWGGVRRGRGRRHRAFALVVADGHVDEKYS
ncbi:hypothetical protein B0H13DRAFT_1919983 [Mycena leptocephala]|nr:hypothetical protein B0H13DRAFT_1919983 [Mycena leptocephala]